jgi:hypothetical protein
MPAQTSGLGAGPPSRTPLTAAATGAIPVSSPARLAPSRRTLEYHSTKAAAAKRQQAEALTGSIVAYERLFGPESEWVTGTRLLAQFYEDTAREQDRLADLHLELGGGHSSNQSTRSRGH